MGLSPRGRGNPLGRGVHPGRRRTIPARAGEPPKPRTHHPRKRDYPRAGGGTPTQDYRGYVERGLSPRGRGNPFRSPGTPSPDGTIPARAGEPPTPARTTISPRDYPRAGGGTAAALAEKWGASGLSPRGRGNPRRLPARYQGAGTIPARAGEPVLPAATLTDAGDYPRAGGGTIGQLRPVVLDLGLSPRGRGNLRRIRFLPRRPGTIPARAGEPCSGCSARSRDGDYPRAGGGTAGISLVQLVEMGLSPRGRGNQQMVPLLEGAEGTIPARAGEPMPTAAMPMKAQDYPRAGGGTRSKSALTKMTRGLSPRGRGNHLLDAARQPLRGTIPARAGEPGTKATSGCLGGDYPRAGGGTISEESTVSPNMGLSPRGRGNRRQPQEKRRVVGTIPARAGEPSRPVHASSGSRDYPRAGGGTQSSNGKARSTAGLSPRGRGNRDGRDHRDRETGTIPARAGEPSPQTTRVC